jgi:predicted DCC family thiol-disulfide oxidoreductase YuxK
VSGGTSPASGTAPAAGRAEPARLAVFFDGECALCSRLVAWALRRDRDGRLRPVPAASEEARRIAGPDAATRLLAELHTFSPDEGLRTGPSAVASLLSRLPRWRWIAPLVGASALRPVSVPIYRWIAARRGRLGATCPLPGGPATVKRA